MLDLSLTIRRKMENTQAPTHNLTFAGVKADLSLDQLIPGSG